MATVVDYMGMYGLPAGYNLNQDQRVKAGLPNFPKGWDYRNQGWYNPQGVLMGHSAQEDQAITPYGQSGTLDRRISTTPQAARPDLINRYNAWLQAGRPTDMKKWTDLIKSKGLGTSDLRARAINQLGGGTGIKKTPTKKIPTSQAPVRQPMQPINPRLGQGGSSYGS